MAKIGVVERLGQAMAARGLKNLSSECESEDDCGEIWRYSIEDTNGDMLEGSTYLGKIRDYYGESKWAVVLPESASGKIYDNFEDRLDLGGLRLDIPSMLHFWNKEYTHGLSEVQQIVADMIMRTCGVTHYDNVYGEIAGPGRYENCNGTVRYEAIIRSKAEENETSYKFRESTSERPSMPVWQLLSAAGSVVEATPIA